MLQVDALIRFYFQIDPTELSDDEWALCWNQLLFAVNFDGKRYGDVSKMNAQMGNKFTK